jgi:hypothetical protein
MYSVEVPEIGKLFEQSMFPSVLYDREYAFHGRHLFVGEPRIVVASSMNIRQDDKVLEVRYHGRYRLSEALVVIGTILVRSSPCLYLLGPFLCTENLPFDRSSTAHTSPQVLSRFFSFVGEEYVYTGIRYLLASVLGMVSVIG